MFFIQLLSRSLFSTRKTFLRLGILSANTPTNFSQQSYDNKLHQKSLKVDPHFGKLILNLCCNCEISPIDPLTYSDGNMAIISLWGDSLRNMGDIEIFLAGERNDDLRVQVYPPNSNILCKIELPIIYDIEANLTDHADVTIHGMESQDVTLKTEFGNITLNKLKGQNTRISMNSGSFHVGGYLHGNLYLDAKNVTASIDHLQGNECSFQADNLKLHLGSCYVTEGSLFANEADLQLNHMHGQINSHLQKGKMCINGMNGSLHSIMENGEITIQASNLHGKSFVQVNDGMLHISLSNTESQSLHITSPSLIVSEALRKLGTESKTCDDKTDFKFGSSDALIEAFVERGKASVDLQPFTAHGFNLTKR